MSFLSFKVWVLFFFCLSENVLVLHTAFANEDHKKAESSSLFNDEPSLTIAASANDICTNNTVTFLATAVNVGPNPIYQWKKNGVLTGTNSPTYTGTFNTGDVIICSVTFTSATGTQTINSNTIVMDGRNDVVPEVTIVANQQTICAGTTVTFTATNKSSSLNPTYQWKVNGVNVGTNSTIFSSSSLTNGSVVECMMIVPQCGGGSTKDYSNPITITVVSALNPSVAITASTTSICKGSTISFTAVAAQCGTNPGYQWKVNGINAGSGKNIFVTNYLSDGDIVSCVVSPDLSNSCSVTAPVVSNNISVTVKDFIRPTIDISASKAEICSGEQLSFSAKAENAGGSPVFQWQVNGKDVGTNLASYSSNDFQNGDKINCLLTNTNSCQTDPLLSNTITIISKESPVISFNPAQLTISAGSSVQLNATVTGTIDSFAWSPANMLVNANSLMPFTTSLENEVSFQLMAYGANGCHATKSINVAVTRNLYIPNSFTPNGDGLNDIFRIPPGTSLQLKQFHVYDRWGNKIFSTTDISKGWDGRFKGQLLDANSFIYMITGTMDNKEILLKGTVVLLH